MDRRPPQWLEKYLPVADRLAIFYEKFPDGRIQTEIIYHDEHKIIMRAAAYRTTDDPLPGTGHAMEFFNDGGTAENCETSAVGRAFALVGIGVKRDSPGLASREEMERFVSRTQRSGRGVETPAVSTASPVSPPATDPPPTELCSECEADLSKPPASNWFAMKRAKEPNFPNICPKCYNKNNKN